MKEAREIRPGFLIFFLVFYPATDRDCHYLLSRVLA